jgi:hypothetical protein
MSDTKHRKEYWHNRLLNYKIRRLTRGCPEWSLPKQEYETEVKRLESKLEKLDAKLKYMEKD